MRARRFAALAVLSVLAVAMSSGCVQQATYAGNGTIKIIVSILPQKEFVSAVGGERVSVVELIPPGASPATYELTPGDLVNIEDADIYFRIGYIPFEESNLAAIESLKPGMKVVDTSEGIVLRYFGEGEEHTHEESNETVEHDHESVDPHVWLSPRNVEIMTETIYDALSQADPDNAAEYRRNADAYMARLKALDMSLNQTLSGLRTRKLMVFHPSWGYFADDYGLEQIAIEQDGKEPTAEGIASLISQAKKDGIRVIFVQAQFSRETAQAVAEEIGGAVVQIDPLAEDYVDNLQMVGDTIRSSLGG